ncbi:MAG: polymer-forming cytoskeletal protein [Chromatiales bacterium]|jgi:cytoskeletal protein CcmA (bactofilin family)|nr:polymer-forming cytoskeletal protein [Chromatiales bacterium]
MNESKKRKSERLDTLIGPQTELRGDLLFAGGLHIDGNVKGNVVALSDGSSSVVVSDRGAVEGQIRVPYVSINGMVIGDVYAVESVELAARARITGNVYYSRLEVAMGAEVNGSLIHLEEAGVPPAVPGQEIGALPAAERQANS